MRWQQQEGRRECSIAVRILFRIRRVDEDVKAIHLFLCPVACAGAFTGTPTDAACTSSCTAAEAGLQTLLRKSREKKSPNSPQLACKVLRCAWVGVRQYREESASVPNDLREIELTSTSSSSPLLSTSHHYNLQSPL